MSFYKEKIPASLILAMLFIPSIFYWSASGAGEIKRTSQESQASEIWLDESIGSGFRKGLMDAGFSVGAGIGTEIFGTTQEHDLALASLHLGWILTDLMAKGAWYSGNWEFLGEAFAGSQFSPDSRFIAGITPLVRYNFMTLSRWIPFIDAGAGVSYCDIGRPDLSPSFQFNIQVGAGLNYFYEKDKAITIQCRHLHFSSAGIKHPNQGTNTEMLMAGLSWYF